LRRFLPLAVHPSSVTAILFFSGFQTEPVHAIKADAHKIKKARSGYSRNSLDAKCDDRKRKKKIDCRRQYWCIYSDV